MKKPQFERQLDGEQTKLNLFLNVLWFKRYHSIFYKDAIKDLMSAGGIVRITEFVEIAHRIELTYLLSLHLPLQSEWGIVSRLASKSMCDQAASSRAAPKRFKDFDIQPIQYTIFLFGHQ
uniref:Uncharacterized protein n=1 Tax=Romanomermis culicivorax TaxID=13658 RepID=A0A915K0R9_ROMCU